MLSRFVSIQMTLFMTLLLALSLSLMACGKEETAASNDGAAAEESADETPKTPEADKPKADKPKADKPKADKPKADKSKADKSKANDGKGKDKWAEQASSYPESTDGLRKFTKDILSAVEKGKSEKAGTFIAAMALPAPSKFFKKTFNAKASETLLKDYKAMSAGFDPKHPESLLKRYQGYVKDGLTKIKVYEITGPSDDKVSKVQKLAFEAMSDKKKLWTVKLKHPDNAEKKATVASFVYVKGGFRLIGDLKSLKN